jgi:hypothetical protein
MEELTYDDIEDFYNGENYEEARDLEEKDIDPETLYEDVYPDIKIHKDFPRDIINIDISKTIHDKEKPLFEKQEEFENGDILLTENQNGELNLLMNDKANIKFVNEQKNKMYENMSFKSLFSRLGKEFISMIHDLTYLPLDNDIISNLKNIFSKEERILLISIFILLIVITVSFL